MYESTDIIATSYDVVCGIDFDSWLRERARFGAVEGPDFLGIVELTYLEAILAGRTYDEIPQSYETIPPPPDQPPESEDDLPGAFAMPLRRELRDLLAVVPSDKLADIGRAWAAIEEFGRLGEREFTEWFLPFFEQFVGRARTARGRDLDLFVVSWTKQLGRHSRALAHASTNTRIETACYPAGPPCRERAL